VMPPFGFSLATEPAPTGTEVWTYGFPRPQAPTERSGHWLPEGRFLQGSISRRFSSGKERVASYELDLRAPEGFSGAPVVAIRSRRVIGVLYAAWEVALPEVQRSESFALAHDTPTLRELAGAATAGRPLSKLVGD
jgi:hypothetical protein